MIKNKKKYTNNTTVKITLRGYNTRTVKIRKKVTPNLIKVTPPLEFQFEREQKLISHTKKERDGTQTPS